MISHPVLVDIHHNGKLEAAGVPLDEALPLPENQETYDQVLIDIEANGFADVGGGAAPHFVVKAHNSVVPEAGA